MNYADFELAHSDKGFSVAVFGQDLDYTARITFADKTVKEFAMGFDDGGFWSADEIAAQGDDLPPHLKF